jgi:hypothetical protein
MISSRQLERPPASVANGQEERTGVAIVDDSVAVIEELRATRVTSDDAHHAHRVQGRCLMDAIVEPIGRCVSEQLVHARVYRSASVVRGDYVDGERPVP